MPSSSCNSYRVILSLICVFHINFCESSRVTTGSMSLHENANNLAESSIALLNSLGGEDAEPGSMEKVKENVTVLAADVDENIKNFLVKLKGKVPMIQKFFAKYSATNGQIAGEVQDDVDKLITDTTEKTKEAFQTAGGENPAKAAANLINKLASVLGSEEGDAERMGEELLNNIKYAAKTEANDASMVQGQLKAITSGLLKNLGSDEAELETDLGAMATLNAEKFNELAEKFVKENKGLITQLTNKFKSLKGNVGPMVDSIQEKGSDFVDALKENVEKAGDNEEKIKEAVENALKEGMNALEKEAAPLMDSAKENFEDAMEAVGDNEEKIEEEAKNAMNVVEEKFIGTIDGIEDGIEGAVDTVKEKVDGIEDGIEGAVDTVKEKVDDIDVVDTVKEGVDAVKEKVVEPVVDGIDAVKEKVVDVQGGIKDAVKEKVGGVKEAVKHAIHSAKETLTGTDEEKETLTGTDEEEAWVQPEAWVLFFEKFQSLLDSPERDTDRLRTFVQEKLTNQRAKRHAEYLIDQSELATLKE